MTINPRHPDDYPAMVHASLPSVIVKHLNTVYKPTENSSDFSPAVFWYYSYELDFQKMTGTFDAFLHIVDNWQDPKAHDRKLREWLTHTYKTYLDRFDFDIRRAQDPELMRNPQWLKLLLETIRAFHDIVPLDKLKMIQLKPESPLTFLGCPIDEIFDGTVTIHTSSPTNPDSDDEYENPDEYRD